MKKIGLVFLPLLLSIACYATFILSDALLFLAAFSINNLGVPIVFFTALAVCLGKNKKKLPVILLSAVSLIMIVVLDALMLSAFFGNGKALPFYIGYKIAWALFCAVSILSYAYAHRFFAEKKAFKASVIVFASVLLIFNAVFTSALAPSIAVKYGFDHGVETLIQQASAAALSVASFMIGSIIGNNKRRVKLLIWCSAVAASEFVTLWLSGTPKTMPILHITSAVIWIFGSLIIFGWSLLGDHIRRKTANETK